MVTDRFALLEDAPMENIALIRKVNAHVYWTRTADRLEVGHTLSVPNPRGNPLIFVVEHVHLLQYAPDDSFGVRVACCAAHNEDTHDQLIAGVMEYSSNVRWNDTSAPDTPNVPIHHALLAWQISTNRQKAA